MAGKIEYYKQQTIKVLYDDTTLPESVRNHLVTLENTTKIKREYMVFGGVALLALYLIFGYGAQFICNGIAFAYPAYCSIKALESTNKDDDTRWLTYWVVFAVFSVMEFFSDILLSWFPLYWLAKCIFLVWCFMPTPSNGSDIIYARVIRPFFMKHEKKLDDAMNRVGDKVLQMASDLKSD